MALGDEDVDLGALVNDAASVVRHLLDETTDPDDCLLAEILIDYAVRTYDDAARAVDGGRKAVDLALAQHELAVHRDVRTGSPIVMARALRDAHLLIESERPHGIQRNSARNVLCYLECARSHGAQIRIASTLPPGFVGGAGEAGEPGQTNATRTRGSRRCAACGR